MLFESETILPKLDEKDNVNIKANRKKREEDELVYRGHIPNTQSDRLYDLFTLVRFPREIWKVLELK